MLSAVMALVSCGNSALRVAAAGFAPVVGKGCGIAGVTDWQGGWTRCMLQEGNFGIRPVKCPVSTYCAHKKILASLKKKNNTWLSHTGKMTQVELLVRTELKCLLFQCKILTKISLCFLSLRPPKRRTLFSSQRTSGLVPAIPRRFKDRGSSGPQACSALLKTWHSQKAKLGYEKKSWVWGNGRSRLILEKLHRHIGLLCRAQGS